MLSPARPRKQMLTQQQRNNRRRRANPMQLAYLRKKFNEDPKPDQAAREEIGRAIDMTPRSVQIWFQNNRAKTKDQERKFSMHGRLYSMTTLACSKNVSSIHARSGLNTHDQARVYGSRQYSTGPQRFFTPPPPSHRPRIQGAYASNWWDENHSQPQLVHGPWATHEIQGSESIFETYSKPRAYSEIDVQYAGMLGANKPVDPFSFFTNKETSDRASFASELESLAGLESDFSILDSPTPDSYDAADSVLVPSQTSEHSDVSGTSSQLSENGQISASVEVSLATALTFSEFGLGLAPLDQSLMHEQENVDILFGALDLQVRDKPCDTVRDFNEMPCSILRIGEFVCSYDESLVETLAVQYSPSQHAVQITMRHKERGVITTLERGVLHIPSPQNLHVTSLNSSRIDLELFGVPRLHTVDMMGQPVQAYDPTNGEIYTADQCCIEGDFSEQLTMLRSSGVTSQDLSSNWLIDTDTSAPRSEVQPADLSLISSGTLSNHEPQCTRIPLSTSQLTWSHMY